MTELNRPLPRFSPTRVLQISASGSILLLILLTWIYYAEPFSSLLSPYWNDKATDILTLAAAIGAALAGTRVANQFEKDEAPYRIWGAFAIGLWCWVAGEFCGFYYDAIYWDTGYPDLTFIDLFWMLGYLFLGLSLYYQYRLIFGKNNKRGTRYYLAVILLALLITAVLTNIVINNNLGQGSAWIVLFITVLYPVFDLAEGVSALHLSYLFGRGQWIRPWWGLILFALSDSLNSFYWLGGYDLLPKSFYTALNLISVVSYTASYLVMGLALLSLYFMFHYSEASGLLQPAFQINSKK
ncbi:MAG: hypothetical protein U0Z26_16435 [Anaerolineales bacterium]